MAKFNINTFNPIYPESNDKKGEIQLLKIRDARPVGEDWSDEMRLDFLPCFANSTDDNLRTTPVGRQVMFRQVYSGNPLLFWADVIGDASFLGLGGDTNANLGFFDFVLYNVQKYEALLNDYLSNAGFNASIQISKIHVINSNVQLITDPNGDRGNIYFQTYDVIFYGQQSPNPYIAPYIPPAPVCETLPDYTLGVQFQMTASKGHISVDPAETNVGLIELFAKGGGAGTQAVIGQFRVNTPIPAYFVNGYNYIIEVNYTPLLAGTTIDFTLEVQGVLIPATYTLNDTGNAIYIPCTYTSGNFTIRWSFKKQNPTAGENNPQISFALRTTACIPT